MPVALNWFAGEKRKQSGSATSNGLVGAEEEGSSPG